MPPPLFANLLASRNQPSSMPYVPPPDLCVNCSVQPQAWNPAANSYHQFCSRTCAKAMLSPTSPISPSTSSNTIIGPNPNTIPTPDPRMCKHCKIKSRFYDGTTLHPYCGKRCAGIASGKRPQSMNGPAPTSPPITPSITTDPTQTLTPTMIALLAASANGSGFAKPRGSVISASPTIRRNRPSAHWTSPPKRLCQIPGCPFPAYVARNGDIGQYCSKAHIQLATYGCIRCRKEPTDGAAVFCQFCSGDVFYMAPMIVEVPADHDRYKSVASQFQKKWQHNKNCPEVRAIYKIVNTEDDLKKFDQYIEQVEARGQFVSQGKSRGNENRRWHGTTRNCNIGDTGVTRFCTDTSCALCCIMKNSFDISFSATTGMFGVGIYTTSTSSKSDHFSFNGSPSSWKAMLLNKVAVGFGFKMTSGNTHLKEPPSGYDSVLAEAGNGLNYDELVVYNNDAIRPSYLVMYDIPT